MTFIYLPIRIVEITALVLTEHHVHVAHDASNAKAMGSVPTYWQNLYLEFTVSYFEYAKCITHCLFY